MRNTLNRSSMHLGAVAGNPAIPHFSTALAAALLLLAGAIPASVHAQAITNTYTTLSLSPNPASTNQTVIANVEVNMVKERQTDGPTPSGSLPSGTVAVSGGGQSCAATLASGVGSCTLSFSAPGVYTITANYPGDASYSASSASQDLTVTGPVGVPAVPAPTLSGGMLALLGMLLAASAFFVSRRALR